MFAYHLKAAVDQHRAGRQLIAMCGRLPVGKGFFDGDAELVGAAMCPACLCGADLWPLAIMLSADQVPVNPDLRIDRLGALVRQLPFPTS
jgi:hypothetical protein